ncbi:MAG: pca operon transcription factor PcaQ [Hyphomicrobiales bacterium]|nr:MAG: pca operon transcription factor PcaQ [Hyphomicrobiales bacterium]
MNEIRRLKLKHLETFVEVARQMSVSRAAKVMNLTQPAVSRTLRELEDICGKQLVQKQGRGIKLSEFGDVFLRHAGSSLAAARNGLNALTSTNMSDGPPVRVGALPTVSATIIPDAVAKYLKSGMLNRLKIVSGDNQVLLNQLREGELDMVMGRLPAPENMQGLIFEPIYRDKVVFVVAASHPLAGMLHMPVEAISAYPVMMPNKGSVIRPYVDRLFIEQGIAEPSQMIDTVSDSFGRAFIRKYEAIWIISRGVVSAEIDSKEFTTLPIDTETTMGSVGLNIRAETELSPAAEFFADILRNFNK